MVEKYKSKGYQIIAIEQSENSLDYKNVKATEKTVFILGNEVEGLPNDLLSIVDVVAQIPMAGNKESLNVSVAGGIALFRILDK